MRWKTFFSLLFLCLLTFNVDGQSTLRLMSYNIRHGAGLDERLDFDRIAEVINREHPDVVALQEVDSVTQRIGGRDLLGELGKLTGMQQVYAPAISFDGGKYGIGLLCRKKPLAIRRVPLPGREEPRMLLIAEFEDYVFCCTHLSLTEEDQLASVEKIGKLLENEKKPVFLAGDLNAEPDSPTMKALQKKFVILTGGKEMTIPADNPQSCIDYILGYMANGSRYQVTTNYVVNEPVASDHRPVFVNVSVAGTHPKQDLSWDELQKEYQFPEWYTEARFGIWATIGPQSVPRLGGGWYARHMFMQDVGSQTFGRNAYAYHLKVFGPQSQKGYTEVIHQWKAERLNTDSLVAYFKSLGARYLVVHANHHDHFDNFASTYHPWNSVNMGPHKDIVGLFEQSARKYGLPFGVSSHDDRFLNWWLPAFGADTSGPYKGIPYEGRMTKADGNGKWWEGYDPAQLYGLPPEQRTQEYERKIKENYLLRQQELVTKYKVDLLWVDGYGFPYGNYGKEVFRTLFNNSLKQYGKINAVGIAKVDNESMLVRDIEAGVADTILPYPWDGIFTFTHWFYKEDDPLMHNARTVIELLSDIVSKNGNMLLNVELKADGTIAPEHKKILDEVGQWVRINSKAIYGSRPWTVYGDNLNSCLRNVERHIVNADAGQVLEEAQKENFNARTVNSTPYGSDEVRFTVCGSKLYVIVLNPESGTIRVPVLGFGSSEHPGKISSVRMLGSQQNISFSQSEDNLSMDIPDERPTSYAVVFEVDGAIN